MTNSASNISNDEPQFTHGNLMKHVAIMSFTASIGLMAIFAVDFVDLIFISMLGNAALAAAVGYAGIILFFTNSINIGLSIAAGTLVAKSLGAKKQQSAREYAASIMALGVVFCVMIVALVFAYLSPILSLLGAAGETHQLAINYVGIILPTMPFAAIAFIGMAVLRAHGDAKRAMYCTLAGGVVNAILDPLLIFTFDLGLEGAAFASVCARITMLVFVLYPLIKIHKAVIFPAVKLITNHIKPIFAILLPAMLANIATPVGSAIMMREMAKYGTDAVAGMAIIGRMTPVVFSVVFALSGAIGPIVGQNFGAGNMARVKTAFIDGLKFTFIYVIMVTLMLIMARGYIISLFDAVGEAKNLVLLFCGILSLAFFFNGVIFVANACFNNLGHPIYSTYINWGKHTIGTLPFIIIGGAFWGATGVLLGQALGSFIFAAIAIWLSFKLMNAGGGVQKIMPFQHQSRFHDLHNRRH